MCSTPAVCVIGNVGGNQSNKGFKQGKLSRHSTRVKHPNSKTYKKHIQIVPNSHNQSIKRVYRFNVTEIVKLTKNHRIAKNGQSDIFLCDERC